MSGNKLKLFFLLLIALAAFPGSKLALFSFSPLQPGSQVTALIDIRKGENPSEVTRNLVSLGVIQDGKSFMWLGRLSRQWKNIKAGEYQVSPSLSPLSIFSVLTSGISVAHPVTVREGENMYEIADDLDAKKLAPREKILALAQDPNFIASLGYFKKFKPTRLEGYFYPDTYFFNRAQTPAEMVKEMIQHFFVIWSRSHDERAQQLGMSLHEVITLASMIEKETGAPEERPLISSVFHNRLKKKMKLQSDPTTIYGMWNNYHGKLRRSDLFAQNEYNTYFIPALPAGPISNPGKEALQAALYPSESQYLFFVSHNDGTHQFSRTIEEHNSAVRKFQLDPKARQGKSWRDLKKTATKNKTHSPASVQPK